MILWRAATGRNRLNDPEARRNKLSLKMKPAEAAVLDGVAELALGELSGSSLILESAKAAVRRRGDLEDQSEPLLSMLPLELRRLFLLVPKNRDCFVLRVLIGLTPLGVL
jgi:hypothetical protein